ncbi:TonB-dependent receptor [bacterium SCSIO 12696]|nr:TonB-dependent receptor [bacterium SCSIO 12696]
MNKLSPLAAAIAIASSQLVMAESNSDQVIEEVRVLGHIVRGQMKALSEQRNSNRIVNVVAADGIGKLPDRNAAEAVQRIPGVSIERDQGEGRFVAVRGLPSQWASTTLNGDRLPTAEEETITRATAFDFFPSELIESVEVSKAVTADMEGDAIGGAVNFITRTAPEEEVLSFTAGTGYSEKAEDGGHALNLTYGNRILDDKLGFIVNVSKWERDWATDNFEPRRTGSLGGIRRLELRDYTGTRDTVGFNGAMEYVFDNGDTVFARANYGTLDDDETHYKHRYRFDKDRVELQNIHDILITELTGYQIGGEHQLAETTRLNWQLSTYENEFRYGDLPDAENNSYFVTRFDQTNVGYVGLEDRGDGKNLAYNVIDGGTDEPFGVNTHLPSGYVADPTQASLKSVELYKVFVNEKDKAVLQFDLTTEASDTVEWKYGFKYRDKERISRFTDEFYVWNEDRAGRAAPLLSDFNLMDQPGRNDFFSGDIDTNASADFFQVVSREELVQFWADNQQFFDLSPESDGDTVLVPNGRNFDVEEEQMAVYGMATWNYSENITVVGGLRLEQTTTDVFGQQRVVTDSGESIEDFSDSNDYLSVLPSLHIKYAINDDSNVRFALTRTFARPDFGSLTPSATLDSADGEVDIGNPNLDPTYSWNLDLLYERYLGNLGVVSAGLFHKEISDPIYSSREQGQFRGNDVDIVSFANGASGSLTGLELAFNNSLEFIDPALENFGFQTNLTLMDSEFTLPDGRVAAVPRQADELYNMAVYYDNGVFAARIALNHKGEYIEQYGSDANSDRIYGDYTSLDVTTTWNITDNMLVYLEANNINNEPLIYFIGNEARPAQVEFYGTRAQLGFKYSF